MEAQNFVWKRRSDEWIKENPGKSYMYKENIGTGFEEPPPTKGVSNLREAFIPKRVKEIPAGAVCGIYVIVCEKEKYVYVGESQNIGVRLRNHKMCIDKYKGKGVSYIKMMEHRKKHGIKAFQFLIHQACDAGKLERMELENQAMLHYASMGYSLYNINIGIPCEDRMYCPSEFQSVLKEIIRLLPTNPKLYTDLQNLVAPVKSK